MWWGKSKRGEGEQGEENEKESGIQQNGKRGGKQEKLLVAGKLWRNPDRVSLAAKTPARLKQRRRSLSQGL
jgi:hypothetical protein